MSAKRNAILATAKRLFAQEGYHSTGVDKIASASGASKMTLYSQFGSKEHLIAEVLNLRHEEFIKSLRDAINEAPSGIARLVAIFEWHGKWFRSPDFHGCMFIKASDEFSGQSELIMDIARSHKMQIFQMIENCLVEDGIKDTPALARVLFNTIEGMIVNAQMFGPEQMISVEWPQIRAIIGDQLPHIS